MLADSIIDQIDTNYLQQVREHIHMYPELGFDVYNTATFIASKLEKLGLSVKRNIGKTGLIADLIINPNYKMIALRADMDALPIHEQNSCKYRSTIDGKAHMCGHDAHCAIVLTTAHTLVRIKNQLKVNIRFLFQPSEEVLPGGASIMIQDGALDGVSEIYGIHVLPTIDEGKIQICQPVALSGVDLFDIHFLGKGGHASTPFTTNDPIIMATQFVNQVQSIVSRNLSSFDPAVVSVTALNAGSVYNVITDKAELKGCIRYLSQDAREIVKKRLYEIANGIAVTYAGKVEIRYHNGYPETRNDGTCAQKSFQAAQSALGKGNVLVSNIPWMASEDFSYFAHKIPACYVFLGVRNESQGYTSMVHEPTFDLSLNAMVYGVVYYLALCLGQ
ncbi:M20 metallopeptidase family protein [Fastidiosibacter lacustris]|uniref:M20 metallopeptidase family protein n=1 Tax=Fastidiosibacter lacustris TaxID=2056695 RepID=UPI000E356AA7|nr:amidohydrolase [Fastidiosibacter lacustris]